MLPVQVELVLSLVICAAEFCLELWLLANSCIFMRYSGTVAFTGTLSHSIHCDLPVFLVCNTVLRLTCEFCDYDYTEIMLQYELSQELC